MSYLVTGGMGFFGANLAEYIARQDSGVPITIVDNLSRPGSRLNLSIVEKLKNVTFIHSDVRDATSLRSVIQKCKPSKIFHLAGQVAMTTSLENPRYDFEVNVGGTFNLLEACRDFAPDAKVIYSSSNKVYGQMKSVDLIERETRYSPIEDKFLEITEDVEFDPESPYGCSKASAEIYVSDFQKMYGLNTAIFRHSSIYGRLQHATVDQGWVGWFLKEYFDRKRMHDHNKPDIAPIDVAGDGKQVRDLLNVDDACFVYFMAAHTDTVNGKYNLGGGLQNSRSIAELFQFLAENFGYEAALNHEQERKSDQKYFVASNASISKLIDWRPKVDWRDGVLRNIDWVNSDAS